MTSRLLDALRRGPLILDSALGTRLHGRGLDFRRDDPSLWNLTHPQEVLALHHRDVAAGSQVLFTNTFGANRSWLARYAQADGVAAINRRAVALARQAAGPAGFVVGDIGPAAAEPAEAAAEQAAVLVDAGVDALILETYRAGVVDGALRRVLASRARPVPVLVSLWQWPDPPDATARRLLDLGAAVLGLNCQPGIEAALAFSQRLARVVPCPLLVKPSRSNTAPADPTSTPSAFAAAVPRLVERNVRLLGGCCGTTEDHVAALAAACVPYQDSARTDETGAER
jgi:methionine synthase I (cobalamin-dependent)